MSLEATVAIRTEKGPFREKNEDWVGALEPPATRPGIDGAYLVADGLGGHQRGEVASALAGQTILDAFFTRRRSSPSNAPPPPAPLEDILADLLQDANSRIYVLGMTGESMHRDPERAGMGTTVTVALLAGDALTIGHVGDSRAYLLRDGALTQLTDDHTLVAQRVLEGVLDPLEIARHPLRNILTQALGIGEKVTPFIRTHRLRPGDRLLLCSDGLYTALGDSALARIIAAAPGCREAVDTLIDEALAADGSDNTTALLVYFEMEAES